MNGVCLLDPKCIALGDRILVITSADNRYEGTLTAINSKDRTVCLQSVKYWGPESTRRESNASTPSNIGTVYESITFWLDSISKVHLKTRRHSCEINDSAVVYTEKAQKVRAANDKRSHGQGSGNSRSFSKKPVGKFNRETKKIANRPQVVAPNQPEIVKNIKPRRSRRFSSGKTKKNDVDCCTPYDIESANSQLQAELANLSLADGPSNPDINHQNKPLASGDNSTVPIAMSSTALQNASSTIDSTNNTSLLVQYNSAENSNNVLGTSSELQADAKTGKNVSLLLAEDRSKSEAIMACYQPTKSFFDNISRSNMFTVNKVQNSNSVIGGTGRRFQKRDIETFGSIAQHNRFAMPNRRRRINVSRNILLPSTA